MGTNRKVTKAESYSKLVWRKFKKSRLGLLGMGVVFLISILSVFAPFFAPNDYLKSYTQSFMPPQQLHLFDEEGNFHLRPFVYDYEFGFDPDTYKRIWLEDTEQLFSIHFFVRGDYYELLGIFPSNIHLFGVEKGGRIFLFGTDQYGRDLLARILMGGRISLFVAFLGAFFGIILGSIIGGISGYYGPVFYKALVFQDMYLAGSFLLILSAILVAGNLLADIILAWIDPRVRYD